MTCFFGKAVSKLCGVCFSDLNFRKVGKFTCLEIGWLPPSLAGPNNDIADLQ